MDRVFFAIGSLYAFLGVGLGAFGAHVLKTRLAPDLLAVFETGVRYQLVRALALLAVAWAWTPGPAPWCCGRGGCCRPACCCSRAACFC